MEISRKPPSSGISGYIQNVRDNKADKSQNEEAQARQNSGDKVQLSENAREVQEAMRAMNDLPEIRTDKVAKLKAEMEQGLYRPDGRKIAFNLLKQSFLDEIG